MEKHEWHKHPSFKNLFDSEISILQRGLKGDFELFQLLEPEQTGGRVVALGELTFNSIQRQKIQIVFPTKYPYAPPNIIACNFDIDDSRNIISPIQPKMFGKGNQYGDGKMCLFEQKFWNKDEHNIGWVLRRAQKWLVSANSQEGFKKEDIIEEYLPSIKHQGQVIIPHEISFPENVKTGDIHLTQFKPNFYILEQNVTGESTFALNLGIETFRWYKFGSGITFKKLFPVFNAQRILDVFIQYFGVNILDNSQNKNIAFYLPDDDNTWHFLKLNIKQNGIQVNIVPFYYIGRIVSNELYLRTRDIFDDKILLKKRVSIIGLGAIGSEVALSLAKNGVGHFNLYDLDTFEIGNSIRHAANLFFIGEDKVSVVKQLIHQSNPNITVNPFKIDVLNDIGLLEESLNNSDLCIILTAEDSVEYLINDYYINNYNIPFVFARASLGAFSGAVQIVDNESACLRCLSLSDADILPKPVNDIRLSELKPEYGSCSSPALPGSEIETKEIALQVARIALQCLLKNENSSYPPLSHKQFYWHGPYGSTNKEPFAWETKNCEKHKDCPICH